MAQQSTDVIGIGVNTLSAYGGRRSDSFSSSFSLEMWAGGTESGGTVSGGTLLASVAYNVASYTPDSFALVSTNYVADASSPYLGQLITARFLNTTGSAHMSMDDVKISTVVPEPASLTAIAAGIWFLKRKRAR